MAGSKPAAEVTSVGFGPDGKPGPNTHHLVHYETQQVSVDNNGIIHPVPMIRPQDVDDVIEALLKAKEVGLEQQDRNRNAQAKADEEFQTQQQARAEAIRRVQEASKNVPKAVDKAKAAKEIQPATSRPVRKPAAAAPRRPAQPRVAAKAVPRAAQKAAPAKKPTKQAKRTAKR